MNEFDILSDKGNIGYYYSCEVTQIFMYDNTQKKVYNLFCIYVMEDLEEIDEKKTYLGKRIKVDKNYSIGIERKRISISDAKRTHSSLLEMAMHKRKGEVDLKIDDPCNIEKIQCRSMQFIPLQNINSIPMNRVLKNNYYNGSYVIEFFDIEKIFLNIVDDEKLIQALKNVSDIIPIQLHLLLDRVGNIIFQFPSSLISVEANTVTHFVGNKKELVPEKSKIEIKRDDRISDQKLKVIVTNESDGIITGCYIGEITNQSIIEATGLNTWDPTTISIFNENGLLLHRSTTSILKEINTVFSISTGIKRQISNGENVDVIELKEQSKTDFSKTDLYENFILNRIYAERLDNLQKEYHFVQYALKHNEHQKAINDIRKLINKFNCKSIYLWDPYLSADDIKNTLYYCSYMNVDMKAITANDAKEIEIDEHAEDTSSVLPDVVSSDIEETHKITTEEWIEKQKEKLRKLDSKGLTFEFRCQHSGVGYKFHDRFLIIKYQDRKSKVWTLGKSINSLGKTHHIFQKVEHSQYIIDAFEELWRSLAVDKCIIWRCKNGKEY